MLKINFKESGGIALKIKILPTIISIAGSILYWKYGSDRRNWRNWSDWKLKFGRQEY